MGASLVLVHLGRVLTDCISGCLDRTSPRAESRAEVLADFITLVVRVILRVRVQARGSRVSHALSLSLSAVLRLGRTNTLIEVGSKNLTLTENLIQNRLWNRLTGSRV